MCLPHAGTPQNLSVQLGAPENLSLELGSDHTSIVASWDAVAGITDYVLYLATESFEDSTDYSQLNGYRAVTANNTTSLTVSDLEPGPYHAVVKASRGENKGPASASATHTVPEPAAALISAVQSRAAVIFNNQLALDVTASSNVEQETTISAWINTTAAEGGLHIIDQQSVPLAPTGNNELNLPVNTWPAEDPFDLGARGEEVMVYVCLGQYNSCASSDGFTLYSDRTSNRGEALPKFN